MIKCTEPGGIYTSPGGLSPGGLSEMSTLWLWMIDTYG